MRNFKGITMVALTVTFIVLLILVGVSITVLIDYPNKAVTASARADKAAEDEKKELDSVENFEVQNASKLLLRNNVKVGDYIEYPFEYYDVYEDGKYYSAINGWRVLDVDRNEGVKIISTGIPVEWKYYFGGSVLADSFEQIKNFRNHDMDFVEGSEFKIPGLAEKVENLSLANLNSLCNKIYGTTRSENDTSNIIADYDLFYTSNLESYYWLSTNDNEKLYCVYENAIISQNDMRYGIRPVITLNKNLLGIHNGNVWTNIT